MSSKSKRSPAEMTKKRIEWKAGDTFANEHNQLLRIVAVVPARMSVSTRYSSVAGELLVVEVTEQFLQYVPSNEFKPHSHGWRQIPSTPTTCLNSTPQHTVILN